MTDYSLCRTYGHSWFEYDSNWTPMYGVPFTLRCERCNMERRDAVDRYNGRLLNRHYSYPNDYRTPKTSKDEWRLIRVYAVHGKARRTRKKKSA